VRCGTRSRISRWEERTAVVKDAGVGGNDDFAITVKVRVLGADGVLEGHASAVQDRHSISVVSVCQRRRLNKEDIGLVGEPRGGGFHSVSSLNDLDGEQAE